MTAKKVKATCLYERFRNLKTMNLKTGYCIFLICFFLGKKITYYYDLQQESFGIFKKGGIIYKKSKPPRGIYLGSTPESVIPSDMK